MIHYFSNTNTLIQQVVKAFVEQAKHAIQTKGRFVVAISGGATPTAMFTALADEINSIEWHKVVIIWVDERFVPHDHSESNYGIAYKAGLYKLPAHLLPFPTHIPVELSVRVYQNYIIQLLGEKQRIDYLLLGAGIDGHTASIFPEDLRSDTAQAFTQSVLASKHPVSGQQRLSLGFPLLFDASYIALLLTGEAKKEILKGLKIGAQQLPIEKIYQRAGNMHIFTDITLGES